MEGESILQLSAVSAPHLGASSLGGTPELILTWWHSLFLNMVGLQV